MSDRLKAKLAPAVVFLGSAAEGKVHLIASVDQPAVDRGLSAVDLIKQIAPIVGGGGGGRATMARAGGSDPGQAAGGRRGGGERDPDEAAQLGMRVIALDYGRARTGVAISDPTATLARPLTVVERVRTPAGMDELVRLIDDTEAELVVVGLPLTLAGETGRAGVGDAGVRARAA